MCYSERKGNWTRFLNHSCEPNLFLQNVFIESRNPQLSEIAVFAKDNISAGELNTAVFTYGADFRLIPFRH